jgi:hypothetical protein
VESRHDRPAEPAFGQRALHVHPDVPCPHSEAEQEQPDHHRHYANQVAERSNGHPDGDQQRRGADSRARTQMPDDHPGQWYRNDRTCGHRQQHQTQLRWGEVEPVTNLGNARCPAGERDPGNDEDRISREDG